MVDVIEFGSALLPEHYWSRVQRRDDSNCWLWTGSKYKKGYGAFWMGRNMGSHILMCLTAHGPKPSPEAQALHSCDTPSCVNPEHLRWGTHAENMQDRRQDRGRCRAGIRNAEKTHCPYGHPYNKTNTGRNSSTGRSRTCRICRAAQQRERRRRKALERAAAKGA